MSEWGLYVAKILISAAAFTFITEVARRNTALAALVTALPLTTVLALLWMHHTGAEPTRLATYLGETLWYVLPSLLFFILMPILLRKGMSFYLAFLLSAAATVVLYLVMVRVLDRFLGIKL